MDWKIIIELIHAIAWPLVVGVTFLVYREQLSTFVTGLSQRVTKLSAFEISIELAELPSPPLPWSDPRIPQGSEMIGGDVASTTLMTLFDRIGKDYPLEYLIVDIKDGKFWLVSRVYIFTVFLQAMCGVKCVVFVESNNEHYRRLIGLAPADSVVNALRGTYPWLEKALSNAMINQKTAFLEASIASSKAGEIIREFIEQPEMRKRDLPDPSDKWTQLGEHPIWEHTEWLTREKLTAYLRRIFFDWDLSHYMDTPGIKADDRIRELLLREAPYIALVNSKGGFKQLLNRNKLLEQVARSIEK